MQRGPRVARVTSSGIGGSTVSPGQRRRWPRSTIVAGAILLVAAMRAFGLDEVELSEHDILYGVAVTPRI
ncbi:MAG: hypothetical protein LT070_04705 [Solirubrobacteraceae bacterium]|nr:hypothetical protein [Solirubrobacteraceae bacterium]